ncbi:galactoside-binding lectin [Oesophagostomum dentatum]|uniref:Galectin n=1 Tax=Oesophagostomum dentatum TaxID=61180 RepID=A0A0B1TL69_OESDE|nr:galactoside-binding lectin [Oesophagostomum dentatum]
MRIQVNFCIGSDIAYHFNPRFNENCVVGNTRREGSWMEEERCPMPFRYDRVYTVEFISKFGQIQVFINGTLFTTFVERMPGSDGLCLPRFASEIEEEISLT